MVLRRISQARKQRYGRNHLKYKTSIPFRKTTKNNKTKSILKNMNTNFTPIL